MGIWGCRVVVVEHDAGTLEVLGRVLRAHGAEIVPVDHAGGALATIVGVIPDVLVMNVEMPALDAANVIRKLRSLSPERGGRIPAVTLSSAADSDRNAAWIAAGFQAHLTRPCDPEAIVAVLEELAGQPVERRAQALDRESWPTLRDRRSARRPDPPTVLQGTAGGNPTLLREMLSDPLTSRRQLG
jgi:CheY-like chemotaxis protein